MKNCVVIVKKSALDALCKNYPHFILKKQFDVQRQQFIISVIDINTNNQVYGFEKSDCIHFTYDGDVRFTDLFVGHKIEFSFSEADEEYLNSFYHRLIPPINNGS